MSIKKRRKIKVRRRKLSAIDNLNRMADIALYKDDEELAEIYINTFDRCMLARLQSIAAKAEEQRNWEFMDGCFKQASELYVLASVLYEKFPEHVMLSDGAFDGLARWLLKNKKKIPDDFWNWYNITAMGLKAGSGYNVAARKPIPQYVYLITGKRIDEHDGTRSHDRPRILRRKAKSGSKRTSVGGGGKTTKLVRTIK